MNTLIRHNQQVILVSDGIALFFYILFRFFYKKSKDDWLCTCPRSLERIVFPFEKAVKTPLEDTIRPFVVICTCTVAVLCFWLSAFCGIVATLTGQFLPAGLVYYLIISTCWISGMGADLWILIHKLRQQEYQRKGKVLFWIILIALGILAVLSLGPILWLG